MTEEETNNQAQPTEQPQTEQPQIEQPEVTEQTEEQQQPNEQSNEQDEQTDKNVTLMSMRLRSQPPHRRYTTLVAELQDPGLYDIEKGLKINPIQLRKGPHNRMPRQAVEFQDKVLFDPKTQIRKNPLELRKSPRGRRYSHVVSAAMNGEPLIVNNQLPYKLQYNNEAEDVYKSSAASSPSRAQQNENKKVNGNKNNEEESGFESATSSSSDYEKSIPKSISSLHDYNELGNGSNSDNGEQKEQKENPLRSRTGPRRRVSSDVAPLLDQSKLEIKDRSANMPNFIEGVESKDEINELDMNDSNNVADTAPWVINEPNEEIGEIKERKIDLEPNDELGEVKERKIDLESMLEGQELNEEPVQLNVDDPSNYANNEPWVILPRFDVSERSINLEDDQSYITVDDDGRRFADNAPWVLQEGESPSTTTSTSTGSQEVPQVRERETVVIQQPSDKEEDYQTIGEDGRNYADSAPWVVQEGESPNAPSEDANSPSESQQTPERHESQHSQTIEQEFESNINEQPEAEENYETIGEDGRNYADGAPWVVQDENDLNKSEETSKPEETPKPEETAKPEENAEDQKGETNEQEPGSQIPEEGEENYETIGEDGRNYADGAPWVVQDENDLNKSEETPKPEETAEDQKAEANEQEHESNIPEEQPEEGEGNYETIGEDGRNYADSAPWVVQDENDLNKSEETPKPEETAEDQKAESNEQEHESNIPEEGEENYETVGEDGRNYADSAPWVIQDENDLNKPEDQKGETNEQGPEEGEENYETIGEDGRNYADTAPWVIQDENDLNKSEETPKQEASEIQERNIEDQEPESNPVEQQPEEGEENYEKIGEDGRNYADSAPWVVQDQDNLNKPEEGQENPEGENGEQEREIVTPEEEENYETIGEDGRNYADNAPWIIQDENKLNGQEEEQLNEELQQQPEEELQQQQEEEEQLNEELLQPEEGQENQEGEAGEQERDTNFPEEEENYETIGEDGRNYADNAPWVVQDEDKLNEQENEENPETQQPEEEQLNEELQQQQEEEQLNEELLQPEEGQGGEEEEAGEQERDANFPEEEENYETIGEDGRNYADNAPWVVQDEDKLNGQEEEQENEKPSEAPTTQPDKKKGGSKSPSKAQEGKPRKMKKNKNVKKVTVEIQTDESYLKDHQKDNNKRSSPSKKSSPTKSNVQTRSLNVDDEEPVSQQSESTQKKPAQKPKQQSTSSTKKQPTTTTKKPQQQQKEQQQKQQQKEQSSEPAPAKKTTTKSASANKKPTSSASTTNKKQPTSSSSTAATKKPAENKVTTGKQGTKEPKLDKNNKKNYADNQPWVIHDEQEAKKPESTTTTSRSVKTNNTNTSSKKQPTTSSTKTKKQQPESAENEPKKATTSKKQQQQESTEKQPKKTTTSKKQQQQPESTENQPKKTTTSKKQQQQQPSSTSDNKSKQSNTSSQKPAQKKDTKKQTTSSTTKKSATTKPESKASSKTQNAPLDKDDPNNYADNQPWVIHDDNQKAASSSAAPKSTKGSKKDTTSSASKQQDPSKKSTKQSTTSKPTNKSTTAAKKQDEEKPASSTATTRSAKVNPTTTKKQQQQQQQPAESKKKSAPATSSSKSNKSQPQQKQQQQNKAKGKTTQKKSTNKQNESFKADTLEDLPPEVRNSPIGKKIMRAEKTTSEAWHKQGLLNSILYGLPQVSKPSRVSSPTKSKSSSTIKTKNDNGIYGETEMREFIKKEIEKRRDEDNNNYQFNVCIVGPHLSGKSTLLSIFTDELLADMTTNESWKSTFIFIYDCSSFIPFISNYNDLYRNMVEASVNCVTWSRPQLFIFKQDLENYFLDVIKPKNPPKNGFLQDQELTDEELEKVSESIDPDAVKSLGEEIHQTWNENVNCEDIYKLIFEFPMKLAQSCKFEKFIYILDHVDDCISLQVKPNVESNEAENNDNDNDNNDNNEISLNEIMSEMLDNTNCIVSCHIPDQFIELKKDFDRIDISTILEDNNNNNYKFNYQIKEQPKKNFELTVGHLMNSPASLAIWEKMTKTADAISKAPKKEKVELEKTLKIQTQDLVNVIYAGEIAQSGDKTVEKVQLLKNSK